MPPSTSRSASMGRDLVRPVRLDPRSGTPPAPRRLADLPGELDPADALLPGAGRRSGGRPAPPAALRWAWPLRVAGRIIGGVPPGTRRHDPAPACQRLRRGEPRGAAATGGRDDPLPVRHARVGAAVAIRGGLGRPPARLSTVSASPRRSARRTGVMGAGGAAPRAGRPRYSPITAQSIPIMMKKPVNLSLI